jgi:hypothetical protein
MSVTFESQTRVAALQHSMRSVPPRRVHEHGLDNAYRAACARHDCERREHALRRRNLTNPVWNPWAL